MILNSDRIQASLRRLAGEMQSQPCSISLYTFKFSTIARVMHLENQHRTCRNLLSGASWKHIDSLTRCISGEEQTECVTTFRSSRTLKRRSAVWRATTVVYHRSVSLHFQQRAVAIKHIALH